MMGLGIAFNSFLKNTRALLCEAQPINQPNEGPNLLKNAFLLLLLLYFLCFQVKYDSSEVYLKNGLIQNHLS